MTPQEAIKALEFDNEMMLFEPMTGEVKSYEQLNEENRNCYDANILAIAALEKQIAKKSDNHIDYDEDEGEWR